MTSRSNDQNRSRREFGEVFDAGRASVIASELSSRSAEGRVLIARQNAIVKELQKSGRIGGGKVTRDSKGKFTGRSQATQRGKAFAANLAQLRSEQEFRGRILQRTRKSQLSISQQSDIIMMRIFYGRRAA